MRTTILSVLHPQVVTATAHGDSAVFPLPSSLFRTLRPAGGLHGHS